MCVQFGNGGHLAAEQLVTTHVWLVRAIAKKVLEKLPCHVELNDLIEDGVFGLIAAAQRYDPARGIPFPLYAKHRIRGAILDGLRRVDHLSRDLRSKVKKADAAPLRTNRARSRAGGLAGKHGRSHMDGNVAGAERHRHRACTFRMLKRETVRAGGRRRVAA